MNTAARFNLSYITLIPPYPSAVLTRRWGEERKTLCVASKWRGKNRHTLITGEKSVDGGGGGVSLPTEFMVETTPPPPPPQTYLSVKTGKRSAGGRGTHTLATQLQGRSIFGTVIASGREKSLIGSGVCEILPVFLLSRRLITKKSQICCLIHPVSIDSISNSRRRLLSLYCCQRRRCSSSFFNLVIFCPFSAPSLPTPAAARYLHSLSTTCHIQTL